LPRVTFTNPTIASVGDLIEKESTKLFDLNFIKIDKARTNYETQAFGVVNINVKTGNIVGVSLFGNFSEDLINVFTLIIDEKIRILQLTDFITPYPTYANILHNLTLDYISYLLSNWKKHPLGSIKQFIAYLFL